MASVLLSNSGSRKLRVAVLFSGRGSNLQALITAAARPGAAFELVAAFSDRPQAPGLAHAAAAGLPARVFEPKAYADKASFESALFNAVAGSGAELVVLAGFMRVLTAASVGALRGRLINIHPSLLPLYPGLDTHARALADGALAHGASVHFVNAQVDGGPLLMQVRIDIRPGESSDLLRARLLPEEHRLLVAAIDLIAQGRVQLDSDSNGVVVDGVRLREPMLLDTH